MEIEVNTKNAEKSIRAAKICEEIFDSVTIYMHITTQDFSSKEVLAEDGVSIPVVVRLRREPLSRLSFSNIPFTDPQWKENLHHLDINEIPEDSEDNTTGLSYNIHKKLMLDLAYIFTLRGHEVFICLSQNPSQNNGHYSHMSRLINNAMVGIKEEADKVKTSQE